MKKSLLITFALISGLSCSAQAQQSQNVQADAARIKAHLTFLADDLLEGRDTGSRGHEIAALYIASQFAQLGLTPAGDNGTYMQRVPLRQSHLVQSSPKLTLAGPEGQISLSYPKDYITSGSVAFSLAHLQGEMVFAGYGIVAPELGHDDYAGLDVKGKVVVLLSGKPESFPSEEGAHFGSGSEKSRHAIANGAIGMITISTPLAEKVRPYQTLLNYLHTPKMRWLDKSGNPHEAFPELLNDAYFSQDAAAKLFADAPMSLKDIYAQLEKGNTPKGFALKTRIDFTKQSEHENISSPNVAAILEGSDPVFKNEYVVFSAHSDHIGFAKTVLKDKINNGAMDNATGTSVLLETARLFAELPMRPKRSILFVAVTGEEKGLLGADYFAQQPTVPLNAMVANVNLDMPILTFESADVIAFGANHSSLQQTVSEAAKAAGLSLSPDPWPEQALFTRSDHYMFVKQGIPSVFLVPGLKSMDPNVDGAKKFGEFIQKHYHKPSDELNDSFNWQAAKRFAEVNFQIGLSLADDNKRPTWNEDDFFGRAFSK
ncbi:M28 family metallopeptidase [Aliiglaciecola sp. CAU 1673]|uniref:M28 family metallopeptidase n=1 Tax=Aliiglaciecola sp. CAU 1673 TaxID=3032595 RepID=UPI0023DB93A3|nr:M28 family metallopeptidase [Aliiglaciecola sp. CAU 1673]MDF2179291.1 M28 family metallopeptidase [Aliiglaciecola sp. CAU 1673]